MTPQNYLKRGWRWECWWINQKCLFPLFPWNLQPYPQVELLWLSFLSLTAPHPPLPVAPFFYSERRGRRGWGGQCWGRTGRSTSGEHSRVRCICSEVNEMEALKKELEYHLNLLMPGEEARGRREGRTRQRARPEQRRGGGTAPGLIARLPDLFLKIVHICYCHS